MAAHLKTFGITDMIKLLNSIDDKKTAQVIGTDLALYLVFLRQCSFFFGSIAILNVIFIVLFLTGDPKSIDSFREHSDTMYAMQALTILNVSDSKWKVLLCFLNTVLTITAMMFNFIFSYKRHFDSMDTRKVDQCELNDEAISINKISELEVSMHSIQVSGFSKDVPREEMERQIRDILSQML
jgi:hypothetical protein